MIFSSFKNHLESLLALCLTKMQIVLSPYPKWRIRKECHFQCETLKTPLPQQALALDQLRSALQRMAKHLPWKPKCLELALSAQWLLTRRGLPSTLYFGMIKNKDQEWAAHAWIRCGDQWFIGYEPHIPYAIVGTYARFLS